MIIELRNIHYSERFSEETALFDAAVYVDGKKIGTVSNEGHGGPNDYSFETKDLEAYCETLPPVKSEWAEGGEMKMDLDLLVGDLLDAWLKKKEFARMTRNKTVMKFKGEPEGEFRMVKVPFGPEIKRRMLEKHGDKIEYFLNERAGF